MIVSQKGRYWQEGSQPPEGFAFEADVAIGGTGQVIAGFGGCFNELSARAIEALPEEKTTLSESAALSISVI